MGLASPLFMADEDDNRKPIGFKANAAEHGRWKAAARVAGQDFNSWARGHLEAAATGSTGGILQPEDPQFAAAVAFLRERYPVRDPFDITRMAVLAAEARERKAPGHAFTTKIAAEVTVPIRPPEGSGAPSRPRGGR